MKILVGLYLFISFSCLPFHDIKILDASSQKFEGGREESGSGIQYRIQLIANKDSKKLEIVGVWVDQKMYKPRIVVKSSFQQVGDFQKGDTMLLTFTKWTHKPEAVETLSEELLNNNMPHENPLVSFTPEEANSIIGGYVYSGAQMPELYGKYICADFGTGDEIWSVDAGVKKSIWN